MLRDAPTTYLTRLPLIPRVRACALTGICIRSLGFLVHPLLLKSIINEIRQLRFWREGTGGFEATLHASPRLIGPGKGDVRRPHELGIGEGQSKQRREEEGEERSPHLQTVRHTEFDFTRTRGRPRPCALAYHR